MLQIRTVHEKKRPFSCDKCGNTFGQKSDLTKHVRSARPNDRWSKDGMDGMKGTDTDLTFSPLLFALTDSNSA